MGRVRDVGDRLGRYASTGWGKTESWVQGVLGGPARTRVILVLACVLGLDTADKGTLGAIAGQLEDQLHISYTQVGLLATVVALIGLVVTLPIGMLTDRVNRTRLLSASIVCWAIAMVASALAGSYTSLLLSRLFLGAVTATAGPTVASLTGDFFSGSERGRIYGFILAGELLGTGFGFALAGDIGAAAGWRWAFGVLAAPALVLAYVVWRLPEPARGGQSHLQPGAEHIYGAKEARHSEAPSQEKAGRAQDVEGEPDSLAQRAAEQEHLRPARAMVRHADPGRMPLREAVEYILRVPTNFILIIASALGYFFFAGLRTFAVEYMRGHFGLGAAAASTLLVAIGFGAVVGVLIGGRLADWLVHIGWINGRIVVAAVAFLATVALLLPGILIGSLLIALPLLVLGALALGAPNPPMDAARLDVIHHSLWGRAESVRTILRLCATAIAPLLFGVAADTIGLTAAFAVMLIPLGASGVILFRARRTYPRDVATAAASESATRAYPNR
ncbi:MAG: MFS transporter [Streptosporangiaceae bacterium]